MARIAGVDLPREKRVEIGLTYIFGIGRATADEILSKTGINPDTRVKDLSETEVAQLRDYIEHNLKVEGDLRREFPSISSVLWKSAAIAACVIAAACPFAASRPSRTRAPARAPRSRSRVRRRLPSKPSEEEGTSWRRPLR